MLLNNRIQPVIVLGMHRSGTSLISEILTEIGIFIGDDLNIHNESKSILKINQFIFSFAHAYWDYPLNIEPLYRDEVGCNKIIEYINDTIENTSFKKEFFGKQKKAYNKNNLIWGWKEPRTTTTFPLWYRLFPDAKFIFIHRNGIDVAQSLYIREKERQGKIYNRIHSLKCLDIEGAFKLWEEYNQFFEKNKSIICEENLTVFSYEEFLEKPEIMLRKLSDFIETPIDNNSIKSISSRIESSNAFKFKKDDKLVEFYHKHKESFFMKKYNYQNLI